MYGYVQIYRPDLRFREYDVYRSHYCGLCHALQKRCNLFGRFTLSYDFTFLSLLLDALYEPEEQLQKERCFHKVGKKELVCHSTVIDYTADMHLFFSYLHCKDHWNDERRLSYALLAKQIQSAYQRVCTAYPIKTSAVLQQMQQLFELEQQWETNFLLPAACFGRALAEGFCMKEQDTWSADLYAIGYHLGTFLYVVDAYDDLLKDRKHHVYNPFHQEREQDPAFHKRVSHFLKSAAQSAATAFERLPILKNADLLRNLLYAGIWQAVSKKQNEYQTADPESSNQQKQENNDYVESL